ncbi:D-lactate dehydrogenase [Caulobacter rhizosphaerae]|uniref:D-lactate dehydrogenase n=1 Tax=Caulobacter rhizosphaerae TaxID=2010972 RepID=UPI0013D65BB8|nr:D-lactate dehydrogenase [Caulobacter rhizosphaerae]GGL36293.1 D-lactate dehydrogenase [Caulobacter rhizosphaerae]
MNAFLTNSKIGAGELVHRLRRIVGRSHVLTDEAAAPFAQGYRFGAGTVVAAVRPATLLEMWEVAKLCVGADRIVIPQAANTGLTGGSTPDGVYDREVVVISTGRIQGVFPLRSGKQVVCLAGSSLHELELKLAPLGREPHSVIGSSCIGASVVGGVCNNSGGALVRRGPAYTEYAVFAKVEASGQLRLINHLGVRLGDTPEDILGNLQAGRFADGDIDADDRAASAAHDYASIVRQVDASTPARFNADPSRLFEASGSAGKLIVFAVRLDTFEKIKNNTVFYIGANDTGCLTQLRRLLLSSTTPLPISGEYIHRQAFDLADRYGKDTVLAIQTLGTRRLPTLYRVKAWTDRIFKRLAGLDFVSDKLLQALAGLLPDHLPERLRAFRRRFEHHLILSVSGEARYLTSQAIEEALRGRDADVFICSEEEASAAMLHRFAVAGAAVRYRAVHADEVEDIVALDIALPRNTETWFERLPAAMEERLIGKLYYGHFLCHVFHQDYLVRKGVDAVQLEHDLLKLMDARGAEYPAEHNVGHLYAAKPPLEAHYRDLDPANALNPGIGKTSRQRNWG